MSAHRLVAFIAVLAAAIGFVLWTWPWTPTPAPTVPLPTAGDANGADPTQTATPTRQAVPTSAERAPDVVATVVVRGRCVAAEDGTPVAATVRVGNDDGAAVDQPGALATHALANATTDAGGNFVCAVPIAEPADLRVHATADGRAAASTRNLATSPGTTWDLGDIHLVRTARVRGEVVDTNGAPVPDVEVGLIMLGHEPPALQFLESHTAVTDTRGTFAFPSPIAVGEWYVRVERTGALRNPRKLQVEGAVDQNVRIEVERPDPALALRGRVVDPAGAPLAGVELSAYGEGARGSGVSGPDGTFVVPKGPPHFDRGQNGIDLQANAPGFELVSPGKGEIATWGRSDVVVVLRPLGDFVVRAVDARGALVWPFTVLVGKWSTSGATWHAQATSQQRPGTDHVVLPRLASGAYSLVLVPRDPLLATTAPVPFTVGEAAARELVVRVTERIAVPVEVVDESGAAIPGCTVELVSSLTATPADAKAAAPNLAAARVASAPGPRQIALASAVTDARGHATLAAGAGPWLLRARCATHRPVALPITATHTGIPQRVVLARAAAVHGRLVPVEVLSALGAQQTKAERRLAVVAVAGQEQVARAEVAADGTFVLGPLPPSAVVLQLSTWLAANPVANLTMPHTLGEVDGANTGRIDREYDVAPFAPATATGLVLWDGQPLRHGQFFLRRLRPEPARHVRVPTDGDGRFRTLVVPGEIGPQLAIPSDPGPGHVVVPLPERHAVGAGQSIELRIEARSRRLRLRLLQPDGSVLANARAQPVADGYQRPGTLATDAQGRTELAPAPYGPFRLTTKGSDGRELVADVDIATDAAADVVDVRFTPAAR
jgi:hypothetical protein